MAVVDSPGGVVNLRVVYYGPPGAGKTTNLERVSALIHGSASGRITPRQVGENRIASVEIPLGTLGHLMGSSVVVRLETMQGEVSSGVEGWSQALVGADGIVFVADSLPHARTTNVRALSGIRERLEGRGRSDAAIPVMMQWNKRDSSDARPIAELEMELNHRCFPSIEAASLRGTGVAETLIEILKRTINAAHRRAGGTAQAEAELGQAVTAAIQRLSQSAREASVERFGMTIDRHPSAWPDPHEAPKPYRLSETVWSRETVYAADSLDDERSATRMLAALERATASLDDQHLAGLPHGLMAGLLAGCDRTQGSLLLFRQGASRMEEYEVVPAGTDPLNATQSTSGRTKAAALCSGHEPVFIGNLADEVVLGSMASGTAHLQAALIVPMVFGSLTFGGIVVYVTDGEDKPIAAELDYWRTAATLTSVFLAWQATENRAVVSRRTGQRRRMGDADTTAS